MIRQVLPAAGEALLVAVALLRLPALREPGYARTLELTLLAFAAAHLFEIPAVYSWASNLMGNPAGGATVKLVLALSAAYGIRVLAGTRTRRHLVLAVLVAVAITVPLLIAPPHLAPELLGDAEFYDGGWRSLVLWLPFLAYLTAALGSVAALAWRNSRQMTQPGRTGMTLIAAGCGEGTLYTPLKLTVLAAWHIGGNLAHWTRLDFDVQTVLLLVCSVLIGAGAGWEHLLTLRSDLVAFRDLRRLRPLWASATAVQPGIILRDGCRRPRHRLRRTVVEIRDGLLAIEELLPPEVLPRLTSWAASNFDGIEADAATTALALLWVASNPVAPHPARTALPLGHSDTFRTEVQWLTLVSQTLATITASTSTTNLLSSMPPSLAPLHEPVTRSA